MLQLGVGEFPRLVSVQELAEKEAQFLGEAKSKPVQVLSSNCHPAGAGYRLCKPLQHYQPVYGCIYQ